MTHYKLQYKAQHSATEFSTVLGMIFNTQEAINAYLDLVAETATILEASVEALENYTPSNRKVFATTRSYEQKERSKMTLEEYKQMVEAQRLASLAVAIHALTKSNAIQKEMETK